MVDTSQLVKDYGDIFSTSKVACFISGEETTNLAASAQRNSPLWRLYHERSLLRADMAEAREKLNGNRCIATKNPKILDLLKEDDFYVVVERSQGDMLMAASFMLQDLVNKIWISEKNMPDFIKA